MKVELTEYVIDPICLNRNPRSCEYLERGGWCNLHDYECEKLCSHRIGYKQLDVINSKEDFNEKENF